MARWRPGLLHGDDGDEGEDVFDVEEYDEIYRSYSDAKARLNSMRVSRCFFPVVALVDRGGSSSTAPRAKGTKGRGKSKGKDKATKGPQSWTGGHWAPNLLVLRAGWTLGQELSWFTGQEAPSGRNLQGGHQDHDGRDLRP